MYRKLMSVRILGGIGGAALQLKPYNAARSNPVAGTYNRVTYCVVPGDRGESKMEKKETGPPIEHDESRKHSDVMTDSFGEGYRTRSDEEGFGGVYRGDDPVINPGVNHPDYNKLQGCEVKEKEKARNLKHGAHTT